MGKAEEEQVQDAVPASPELPLENAAGRCPPCRSVGGILSLRCIVALLMGVAVVLSAVFCLPPFFRRDSGAAGDDLDPEYDADVMASFILQKSISMLDANIAKLEYDIFDEIGVPNTTVAVMYLEPLGINSTNVVFGVWPYPKQSQISTVLSILKSSFSSLVLGQTALQLTIPLFGNSYFFQILKFPGGITITPLQNGFFLQKEHVIFNFSLNFPIYEVQDKIDELKDQMKLGLHLNSNEILIVRLTNIMGSTVDPPTVVETSIVLAVGNNQPSVPRLKELAQHIRNSSAGNLGLNHTVFGRVKQIRLSSFLQHSLSSGDGIPLSPSLAPQPSSGLHHHHHSHLHHRGNHPEVIVAPAPAPKSIFTQVAPSPPRCWFGASIKPKVKPQIVPVAAPAPSHHSSSPHPNQGVPAPSPILHPKTRTPPVNFVHAKPPSQHMASIEPPDGAPSISPLQISSFAGGIKISHWIFATTLLHLMRLYL